MALEFNLAKMNRLQGYNFGCMSVRFLSPLVLAMCVLPAVSALAQFELVKKSPFEATKTRTVSRSDGTYTVSDRVARSSDSSTYEEIRDLKTGELIYINIVDVPGRRSIFLDVKAKTYSFPETSLPAVIPDPSSSEDLQKYIDYLKTLRPTHEADGDSDRDITPLGFRTEKGFQEFGRRIVFTRLAPTSSLKEKVWDDWRIPALSVTVEKVGLDAAGNPSNAWKLTDIRAQEPDPRLFEIPEGYAPAAPLNSK